MGKMTPPNTWLNDCSHINCPLYTKLYNSILVEKQAPMKRSIQLFCSKAQYKQTTQNVVIDDKLESEITSLFNNVTEMGFSYGQIEDIDYSSAEIIEQKCMAQEATLYEKLMLKSITLTNNSKMMLFL